MTAYEFYSRDESGELYFIGVLPERRIAQERITDESVINWARSLLGDESRANNISYTEKMLPSKTVVNRPSISSHEIFVKAILMQFPQHTKLSKLSEQACPS